MSFALIHTSAPRGLLPNTRGFTTVAVTEGIPPTWRERLESLSAYESSGPGVSRRPTCHAHFRAEVAGSTRSVVTRIVPAGLDYSGRPNRLAHHILVEPDEMPAAGPAWLLAQDGLFRETWDEQPRTFAEGPRIPSGDIAPRACQRWEQMTGDAGWGGSLIAAWREDPKRPVFLIYPPGTDVLALISETVALLDPADRWEASWCTYFSQIPPNTTCAWRCVVAGTSAARDVTRTPGSKIIDLSTTLPRAPDNPFTLAARRGEFVPQYREAGRIVTPGERIVAPTATLTPEPPAQDLRPLPLEAERLEPERLDLFAAQTARRLPASPPKRQETDHRGPGRWLIWLGGPAVATAVIVTLMMISGPDGEEVPPAVKVAIPDSRQIEAEQLREDNKRLNTINKRLEERNKRLVRNNKQLDDENDRLKKQDQASRAQPEGRPAIATIAPDDAVEPPVAMWTEASDLLGPPLGRFLGSINLTALDRDHPTLKLTPSRPIRFATVYPADTTATKRVANKKKGTRMVATPSDGSLEIVRVQKDALPQSIPEMLAQVTVTDGRVNAKVGQKVPKIIMDNAGIILLDDSDNWQVMHFGRTPARPKKPKYTASECIFPLDGLLNDYSTWHLPPPWIRSGPKWLLQLDDGLSLEVSFSSDKPDIVVKRSGPYAPRTGEFTEFIEVIRKINDYIGMLEDKELSDEDQPQTIKSGQLVQLHNTLCSILKHAIARRATHAGEPIIIHDEWGFPLWKLDVEFGALDVELPPSCPGASRTSRIRVP